MSLGKNKRKKDEQKTEGGCMVCQKDTYYSKVRKKMSSIYVVMLHVIDAPVW